MARCEQGQEYRLTTTSADELKNVPLEFTNIANGKVMVYRDGKFVMEDQESGSEGSTTFTGLTDTPSSYEGVGKFVAINNTNDGLEFVDAPEGGTTIITTPYLSKHLFVEGTSINLEPYKEYDRLIYEVTSDNTSRFVQRLPKISETNSNQIILLDNKSSEDIGITINSGNTIGGSNFAKLPANYHMVLTPNSTTSNWDITFFGEKFEGSVVKKDILNSIKGGTNITVNRTVNGEITINGQEAENTIVLKEGGTVRGIVKKLDFNDDNFNIGVFGDTGVIQSNSRTNTQVRNLAKEAISESNIYALVDVPDYSTSDEESVLTKEGTGLVWKVPTTGVTEDRANQIVDTKIGVLDIPTNDEIKSVVEDTMSTSDIVKQSIDDYIQGVINPVYSKLVTDIYEDIPLVANSYYDIMDSRGNKYSVYVDESNKIPENSVIKDVAGYVRLQGITFPCMVNIRKYSMINPNTNGMILMEIESNFGDRGNTEVTKKIIRLDE